MKFKNIFLKGIDVLGFNALARTLNKKDNIVVLMYHSVVPDDCKWVGEDWLYVKVSEFKKQMNFLSENFHVVPLSTIKNSSTIPIYRSDKPTAVISFDDGYANNYHYAFPILKSYYLPATIFLITDTIDKDQIFWWDKVRLQYPFLSEDKLQAALENLKSLENPEDRIELDPEEIPTKEKEIFRTLRSSEIKEMANSGLITFGSHTHLHTILTNVSLADSQISLQISYDKLKKDIPRSIPFICPPNGNFNQEHINQAEFIGYKGLVTTQFGFHNKLNNNRYCIPRIGIGRNCSLDYFKYITLGAYSFRNLL